MEEVEKIQGAQDVWQHWQETVAKDMQECFTKVAKLESTIVGLVPSTCQILPT